MIFVYIVTVIHSNVDCTDVSQSSPGQTNPGVHMDWSIC